MWLQVLAPRHHRLWNVSAPNTAQCAVLGMDKIQPWPWSLILTSRSSSWHIAQSWRTSAFHHTTHFMITCIFYLLQVWKLSLVGHHHQFQNDLLGIPSPSFSQQSLFHDNSSSKTYPSHLFSFSFCTNSLIIEHYKSFAQHYLWQSCLQTSVHIKIVL